MSSIQNKIKENINPNKVKKCRSNLEKLLDKNRLDSTTGSSVTHVTLDPAFPGKYSFDKSARKKLNKLVKEGNSYNINMSIAEKPKNYGPIKVDIDLEIPKDDYTEGDRLYDTDFIMKSIELYRESIKKYLDIHDSQLQACVLEKSNVTNKGITVRDGIHIFFPYVVAHYKVRHLIREEVVAHAKDIEMFAKFTKNVEEIFDKSVISSNFWLMYGNSKPKCPPYKLTQLIAHDDSELEFTELISEEDDLVDIFSLQNKNWKETNATPLNSLYSNEDIDFECDKKGIDNSK